MISQVKIILISDILMTLLFRVIQRTTAVIYQIVYHMRCIQYTHILFIVVMEFICLCC